LFLKDFERRTAIVAPQELFRDPALALRSARIQRKDRTVRLSVQMDWKSDYLEALLTGIQATQAQVRSKHNLVQLAIAMHHYAESFRRLPPAVIYDKAGKPLHSWRVLLLPFLGQKELYRKFKLDEPWDSAHNRKLLAQMPQVYAPVLGPNKGKPVTFYQVFDGPHAPFSSQKVNGLKSFGEPGKVFGVKLELYESGKVTRMPESFQDGTANTILLIEAGEPVPWTKPVDLQVQAGRPLPPLGGLFSRGYHVAMADATPLFIRRTIRVATLRSAITPSGGELLGADWDDNVSR
jgi:hypothetical protein